MFLSCLLLGVFTGAHGVSEYLLEFFTLTLLGNIFGGVMLVAVVHYAQVAYSDAARSGRLAYRFAHLLQRGIIHPASQLE